MSLVGRRQVSTVNPTLERRTVSKGEAVLIGPATPGDVCEAVKYGHVAASFAVEQIGLPKFTSEDGGRELCNGVSVEDRLQDYKKSLSQLEVSSKGLI